MKPWLEDLSTLSPEPVSTSALGRFQVWIHLPGDKLLRAQASSTQPTKLTGEDSAGIFHSTTFKFHFENSKLELPCSIDFELRHYTEAEAILGFLKYKGSALSATDSLRLSFDLNHFERALVLKRTKPHWTAPDFVESSNQLPASSVLMLWKQSLGHDFHLLAPLAGGGMVGDMGVKTQGTKKHFCISLSSDDEKFVPDRVPVFAYSRTENPDRFVERTLATALKATGAFGKPRVEKDYPEIFESLGWCSWNAFGPKVNQQRILETLTSFQNLKIPIQFVLIDDGWLNLKGRRLRDFKADSKKFPLGLAPLVRKIHDSFQIPHVGVWHTFQGYWQGLDRESFKARNYELIKNSDNCFIPAPRQSEKFFEDWYSLLHADGIDFLKVDNQAKNSEFTKGHLPLFEASTFQQMNMQKVASHYFTSSALPLINCMEMTLENCFNWDRSNIARSSDDYLPANSENTKDHVIHNAYNSLWISAFAFPDWDMFQSHDPNAEFHAVARAISGGPIYITDEPEKQNPDLLKALILRNGKLLRPDSPAQVCKDNLLSDPSTAKIPLKMTTSISRPGVSCQMLAAFNVRKDSKKVTEDISASDWSQKQVVAFSRKQNQILKFDDRSPIALKLEELEFDLLTFAPIQNGCAVFGLLNKYLGAAAIRSVRMTSGKIEISIEEAGELGVYLQERPKRIFIDKIELREFEFSYDDQFLRIPESSFANSKHPKIVIDHHKEPSQTEPLAGL